MQSITQLRSVAHQLQQIAASLEAGSPSPSSTVAPAGDQMTIADLRSVFEQLRAGVGPAAAGGFLCHALCVLKHGPLVAAAIASGNAAAIAAAIAAMVACHADCR